MIEAYYEITMAMMKLMMNYSFSFWKKLPVHIKVGTISFCRPKTSKKLLVVHFPKDHSVYTVISNTVDSEIPKSELEIYIRSSIQSHSILQFTLGMSISVCD